MGDSEPTVALGKPAPAPAPSASLALAHEPITATTVPVAPVPPLMPSPGATSITTPAQALRHDELARNRHFTVFAVGIVIAAVNSMWVFPLSTAKTAVTMGVLALTAAAMGYVQWRSRDPSRPAGSSVAIGWAISSAGAALLMPRFGIFSAVLGIGIVGIYFVGLGASRALAITVYALFALVHGAVAALIIAGVMDDPGILRLVAISDGQLLFIELFVQYMLAATLWLARASRQTTLRTVGALDRAVREVAAREALLAEARQELARVMEPGGAGRFTEQIIGSFRLGAVLGRGGMGEVYEAAHVETGAPAAVKLLTRAALRDASIVRRFLRELTTASTITSPHVVRVLEVGEAPLPYLAMERLHGDDLAALLRRRGRLPVDELLDLVRQLGAGIAAATAVGVVHRDLKPQNVFLAGGTWKVLDFGVAKLVEHDDSTVGLVVGTPAYMAPEQASGQRVDHRADLYALAAIVYRAVTGRPPFVRQDAAAMLYDVVHAMPPRPGALVEAPADVDAVLAIGLAKRPDDRFDSGAALADALAAAFRGALPAELRRRAANLTAARPLGSRRVTSRSPAAPTIWKLRVAAGGGRTYDPAASPEANSARRGGDYCAGALCQMETVSGITQSTNAWQASAARHWLAWPARPSACSAGISAMTLSQVALIDASVESFAYSDCAMAMIASRPPGSAARAAMPAGTSCEIRASTSDGR